MRLVLAIGLIWFFASCGRRDPPSGITTPTRGPYRIAGNVILDAKNRPFLIRGTHVAPLISHEESQNRFDPLSATALITIRQRLNMNAVRVTLDPTEYLDVEEYRTRVDRLLHLANDLELLVIVETDTSGQSLLASFWSRIAGRFQNEPNVFLAPIRRDFVPIIRSAGAKQPLIVEGDPASDAGVIYQITPRYAGSQEVWERMRLVAKAAPVVADDLDPKFEIAGDECAAFPGDPAEATRLVENKLAWLDQERISWTLSSFTAGRLITDYENFNGTNLDDGWTCGKANPVHVGLGLVISAHLWRTLPLSLFVVSQSRGGMVLARGGIATAYGPILADQEMEARPPLPVELGNISVRITDSRGVTRLAQLLYTGAGWAFVNFIVPPDCAAGPADLRIVRKDGSTAESHVLIGDVAPAMLTAAADGRGAPIATVTQVRAGEEGESFRAWTCDGRCRDLPIPLAKSVSTTVQLLGSGFRYTHDKTTVHATASRIEVPVISTGPAAAPGTDQLTIRLPDGLIGAGEVEFYFRADGELSNVVTLNCGRGDGEKP